VLAGTDARTPRARLADQGHPASTGAGMERLAMKGKKVQAGTATRPARFLKVEEVGDFSRGKVVPRIRMAGKWLEQAGFKPGCRVQVVARQPGMLNVHLHDQGSQPGTAI